MIFNKQEKKKKKKENFNIHFLIPNGGLMNYELAWHHNFSRPFNF